MLGVGLGLGLWVGLGVGLGLGLGLWVGLGLGVGLGLWVGLGVGLGLEVGLGLGLGWWVGLGVGLGAGWPSIGGGEKDVVGVGLVLGVGASVGAAGTTGRRGRDGAVPGSDWVAAAKPTTTAPLLGSGVRDGVGVGLSGVLGCGAELGVADWVRFGVDELCGTTTSVLPLGCVVEPKTEPAAA